MRVLVTRPEPGASRTASRLRTLGHEPVILPLFEAQITARPDDLPPVQQVGGLIATSARAFSIFGSNTAPAEYLHLPVYTVGPATAQAARDAGFHDVHEGAGSARDLAGALTAQSGTAVDGPGLLYLAGSPRKPFLEEALTAEGLPLKVLETYRMGQLSYPTDFANTGPFVACPGRCSVLFEQCGIGLLFACQHKKPRQIPAINIPCVPVARNLQCIPRDLDGSCDLGRAP